MAQINRKVVCSIISGFSFLLWVIGISEKNFLLTLISGICFILFLVLAIAQILPPPPPDSSIAPPRSAEEPKNQRKSQKP